MKINRLLTFIVIFLFIIFLKNNSFATYDFVFPSLDTPSFDIIDPNSYDELNYKYYTFLGGFRGTTKNQTDIGTLWIAILSDTKYSLEFFTDFLQYGVSKSTCLKAYVVPENPDTTVYFKIFKMIYDNSSKEYRLYFYDPGFYYPDGVKGSDFEDNKIMFPFYPIDYRNNYSSINIYMRPYKLDSSDTLLHDFYWYKVIEKYDDKGKVYTEQPVDGEGNKLFIFDEEYIFKSNVNIILPDKSTWKDPEILDTDRVTLYIDDMNFRKRFSFIFKIPLLRDDTKYYVFLDKYTRNSYDSVTASFKIYTVTTPEGYDYTDYKNYMYYDDTSKKLVLPAGCEIYEYSTIVNNGEEAVLKEETSYIATRDFDIVSSNFSKQDFYDFLFGELMPDINTLEYSFSDFLFPSSRVIYDFDNSVSLSSIVTNFFVKGFVGISQMNYALNSSGYNDIDSYLFRNILNIFYYCRDFLNYSMDDFCFSNYSIISYEALKNFNFSKTALFYDFLRHTEVYNRENAVDNFTYALNYHDMEDVSSMLPGDINKEYLTSPFFRNNNNSSSGGNITYNITEVIEGDKIINYGREESPYRDKLSDTYIENFNEGDNIIIETESTEDIEKTSQMLGILQGIYWSVLNIEAKMSDLGSSTTNFTENFTYNTHNTINKFFVPSQVNMTEKLTQLNDDAKTHLGIIYEPISVLVYTVTLFTNIDNQDEIKFEVPEISFKGVTLIENKSFSFTSYMENLPVLYKIHQIYLTAVDFLILGLLVRYAIKVSKEVFHK